MMLAGIVGSLVLAIASARLAFGDVSPKEIATNPDAGLSDLQRAATYDQLRQQFATRYEAWLRTLDVTKLDLQKLPRHELLALYGPPQPSVDAAVTNAELAIVGTARGIRSTTFDGAYVTFSVERAMKGSSASSIQIHLGGGLRPTQDWSGVFLAERANSPLLLPGDRAILLLRKEPGSAVYDVQSFTGMYRVISGKVSALLGNPFAYAVEGQSEDAFIARLSSS
jgi:hypothetical protein